MILQAKLRDERRLPGWAVVLAVLAMLPFLLGHAMGDTVYAKRDGAEVRAGTDRQAALVEELRQGDELTVLATEGVRLRVRTPAGNEGYIARLHVTDERPRTQTRRPGFGVQDTMGPSERADVAAIRGLNPVAEEYAASENVPREVVDDIRRMETLSASITDSELNAFLTEGGVTPP